MKNIALMIATVVFLGVSLAGASLNLGPMPQEASAAHSAEYRAAQEILRSERWARAAEAFAAIAEAGRSDADAALYWQAYALRRDAKSVAALAAVQRLIEEYPESSWVDDARALELEIRPDRTPEQQEDDELKLYALHSLMHADPERAVPILERFLEKDGSIELKKQALFVLAQSGSERSREILRDIAIGSSHPELQRQAIEFIGIHGGTGELLEEIYESNPDPEVKSQVLEGLMIGGNRESLHRIAQNETVPELRGRAIEMLAVSGARSELRGLYRAEDDPVVKNRLLESAVITGDSELLRQVLENESDPTIQLKAVELLGVTGGDAAAQTLLDLYRRGGDRKVRETVLSSLMVGGHRSELKAIAETETDVGLKMEAIQMLAVSGGRDALRDIYDSTTDPAVRQAILESAVVSGDVELLERVLATATDQAVQIKAIELMSVTGGSKTSGALLDLYQRGPDVGVKRAIIDSLMISNNAQGLIEILRIEEDRVLKRAALERLSMIDSDEATEYLARLLEED